MDNIVKEHIHCKTADEFINRLSPLNVRFSNENDSVWLFRGQWDADWKLIPSLFRETSLKKIEALSGRKVTGYSDLGKVEKDLLIDFFEVADKRGLPLPDDSQELRSELRKLKNDDSRVEQYFRLPQTASKLFSLLALAQHYGIPTYLLDWTRNSWLAAFFAAEYAFTEKADAGKNIVVWAFSVPVDREKDDFYYLDVPIQVVTAPSATNSNLRAQQGVFTWLNPSFVKYDLDYPSLGEVLNVLADSGYQGNSRAHEFSKKCVFVKYTLPQSEAQSVICLLDKLDITPSSVYPGFHSIVDDIRNKAHWVYRE